MKFSVISGAIFATAMLASGAQAATINFANIMGSGVETGGDSLYSKFTLNVAAGPTGKVLIQVKSAINAGQSYFISSVYVDDDPANVLVEPGVFSAANSVGTVNFASSSGNGDLPQGQNVSFQKTSKYVATVPSGHGNWVPYAVQPGETVGFLFGTTYTVDAIVAAFTAGSLRFGIHVQNIPGCADTSDSYVTQKTSGGVPTVPVPASALLLLGGLGGLAGLKWKKKA